MGRPERPPLVLCAPVRTPIGKFGGALASLTAADLGAAARSLGLKLQRIPRKFGLGDDRVAISGRHRGKRYRLTAAGIRHCEALIEKLLAQ